MTRNEAIRKAINIIVYLKAHFAKSQEAKKDAEEIIKVLEQINEEQRDRKVNKMSMDQLIEIAEKFNKWIIVCDLCGKEVEEVHIVYGDHICSDCLPDMFEKIRVEDLNE